LFEKEQRLHVQMITPAEPVAHPDVAGDEFDLKGFTAAMAESKKHCAVEGPVTGGSVMNNT